MGIEEGSHAALQCCYYNGAPPHVMWHGSVSGSRPVAAGRTHAYSSQGSELAAAGTAIQDGEARGPPQCRRR